jgi:TolB-like protein/Tfp pilus assembly protein PilF/predicted Ser/Thr protein kinase
MSLPIGARLGSYEITSLLGSGGMGQVYRAKDLKLGRDVAIKVLREELASDPERLRRFEQEARSASALNHPNIITIHDIGKHDATPYIAMEYVEGKTLREMLGGGPLPTKKLLQLATQIAEGLAKAHSAGIVHRDLKPENLMVTSDGYVKILDFGLAKLLPEAVDYGSEETTITKELTRAGVILGTIGYMSPEQASGRPIDPRSDQFSLGSILYEMATGKVAFKRDTAAATLAAIIEGEPEPVAKVNPNVSPHLRVIVERCLKKHPEERYESTRDLARELEGLRELPFELPAILSRRAVLAGVSALVVLGLALLVGLNVGGLRDRLTGGASPIDSLAVLPLVNAAGDPEQEYFVDGITEALITDLAKIGALKVISRNSAMRYKDTDKSIPEIAEELGVDAVIEGSVLREGERVRITAQLIEAQTDQYLWADNFDRELRDVMALYSEVARTIAREIEINVAPEEERRLASARAVDPEAHEAYLKGLFHYHRLNPQDLDTALSYFELALEKDPDYAPAYVGIAGVWFGRRQLMVAPEGEATPLEKAAVLKALELDESLGEAHYGMARLKTWGEKDWPSAERAFERAIELSPGNAEARTFYSHLLNGMGRSDEAMIQAQRALDLDPFNAVCHLSYGMTLVFDRRYDDAIVAFRETLTLSPTMPPPLIQIGDILHLTGRYEEALDAQKAFFTALGDDESQGALAQGYAEGGYAEAMRRSTETYAARSLKTDTGHFFVAHFYVRAGEKERALEWLERSFANGKQSFAPYIRHPVFDSVRDDPRYQSILRSLNIPE